MIGLFSYSKMGRFSFLSPFLFMSRTKYGVHNYGGIFTGEYGNRLNDAVTIIGYGQYKNGKYWLIRNSWEKGWGKGCYSLHEDAKGRWCP